MRPMPLVLSLLLGLFACGKEAAQDESGIGAAPGAATEEPEAKDSKRKRRDGKDRGEASMQLDGAEWQASRASARLDGDKLKLSMVKSNYTGGVGERESVDLVVPGYKGPGLYQADSGSRFVGVAIDTAAAKSAGDDDKAVQKEAAKALSGAKHLMLSGAKVEVTSADAEEISGTFEFSGAGSNIESGRFRARVRKARD